MNIKLLLKVTITISSLVIFFIPSVLSNSIQSYKCGDFDNTGIIDISDMVYMVEFQFEGGPPPDYVWQGDFDQTGEIDIADLVIMVEYMFLEGPPLYCIFLHEENSGPCLNQFEYVDKNDGCGDTLVGNGTEDMIAEWFGDRIKITHNNFFWHCCLDYRVNYNIQYVGEYIIVDAYEIDDAPSICFTSDYYQRESMSPNINYSPLMETECIVTLYNFGDVIVKVDTITIGGIGTLETEVSGNDLTIKHNNALYNCCPGFYVDYNFEDNNISVTWGDSLNMCDCICRYNLESTLFDLPEGEYIVTLFNGGYTFGGEIVGVDTVVIGEPETEITEYDHGPCTMLKNEPIEEIIYNYSDGDLTLIHNNAEFNCAFILQFYFEQTGDTLRFYEINVTTEFAMCLCYYNITGTVSNIPPGEYVVELYARDMSEKLIDRRNLSF
ncbi:hypothetical protein ACFLQG_01000 [Candidatus Zixiibacteriota bacterium]